MAKKDTKSILAANWNPTVAVPPAEVARAKAGYESARRQELSGTGIADQYGLSWSAQQAANTQQTQQAAAAAAAEGKRITARKNPTANVKFSKAKGVK